MAGDLNLSNEDMGPIAGINITPFVDVVLVLLVIFMITAPAFMKDAFQLNLPKASSADAKVLEPLAVAVTRQGQILVNGQLADAASITEQVRALIAKNPEAQALIAADADARHADVVRAIDLIKSAGLNRFALQIERP